MGKSAAGYNGGNCSKKLEEQEREGPMRKYGTTWAVFVLLLVFVVFVFSLTNIKKDGSELGYSSLLSLIESKRSEIEHVYIVNGDDIVRVKFRSNPKAKLVVVPTEAKEHLVKSINEARIPLSVGAPDKSGMWLNIISSFFLPVLVLVGLLFMFRSAQSSQSRQVESLSASLSGADKVQELERRIAELEAEVAVLRSRLD